MRVGIAIWVASIALISGLFWVASLFPVPSGWDYADVEYHFTPLMIGVVPVAVWAYRKPLRQYRGYVDGDPDDRWRWVSVVASMFGIWALKGTGEVFFMTAYVLDSGVAGVVAGVVWVVAMTYIMVAIWR